MPNALIICMVLLAAVLVYADMLDAFGCVDDEVCSTIQEDARKRLKA